jgi:hypothetical protein
LTEKSFCPKDAQNLYLAANDVIIMDAIMDELDGASPGELTVPLQ